MPRRNRNAQGKDFESMSVYKIKALLEQLQWEWKQRTMPWSAEAGAPCPAPESRW